MKKILLIATLFCGTKSYCQNEIVTPAGLPLKVGLLDATGNFNINTGSLLLNNKVFLSGRGTQNTFVGEESGLFTTTGDQNSFYGLSSGRTNTSGKWNSFFGANSGYSNTTGDRNIFIGGGSGYFNTTGRLNTFVGYASGYQNTLGTNNVFFGLSAGNDNTTGSFNTYIGYGTANNNSTGSNNVALGNLAGNANLVGSGNTFLGNRAGYNETGSNKLYISNSDTNSPLIYGDFSAAKLVFNGQVGAGTSNFPNSVTLSAADGGGQGNTSAYKLFVKGGILTEQLIIASGWADYVFKKDYKLQPLSEVEKYIKTRGHLPNVPSANDVEKHGLDVADIARIQQEKIEELILYIIALNKELSTQREEMKTQSQEFKALRKQVIKSKK